jgi:hypothetical protein
MAHTIINADTNTLNSGSVTSRNKLSSVPKVDIIVSVNVTIDTLAEIKLITLAQE